MTINDSFDLFINYTKSYCAKDTILFYENCIRIFRRFLNDTDVDLSCDVIRIDKALIVDYILFLRGLDISNTSLRTYIRGLKVYLRYLYFEFYIPVDVTQRLKLPKADDSKKMPLSNLQVSLLDDFLFRESRYRDICIIHLMLDCGLRLQEVAALNVSDIQYSQGRSFVFVRNSKNNKSRVVPLPDYLYRWINDYRTFENIKSRCLFLSSTGKRLTANGIKTMFTKLKNIVPCIHAHLLRHTFATSFIMGGGNLENLRVLMGHSSYAVTQNYIHLASELSLVNYDVYKIDNIFFKTYDYHNRNT